MRNHDSYQKNMLTTFRRYLDHYRRFGLGGVHLLSNLDKENSSLLQLKLTEYSNPINLRVGTSDVPTFYKIFYFKEYDIKLEINPKVIIDCGANIGLSSIYYSNRYPNAKIYAIEPEKSNYDLLVKNCKAYPNVICLNFGVWNKVTNLNIQDGSGNWGFRTFESEEVSTNSISAISIDYLMDSYKIDQIDILKVDIEGSEKELFESNFDKWLPKTKTIIIELHDNIKKGCSKSLFRALDYYDYTLSASGENFICKIF